MNFSYDEYYIESADGLKSSVVSFDVEVTSFSVEEPSRYSPGDSECEYTITDMVVLPGNDDAELDLTLEECIDYLDGDDSLADDVFEKCQNYDDRY